MNKKYSKKDFEGCPRFMPMQLDDESIVWYIFDTEKLDFLGNIVPYYSLKKCEHACNILNGVDYLLKSDSE